MRLRIATTLAIALVAFYAGVALQSALTTPQIVIPTSAPSAVTSGGNGNGRTLWVTETVASTTKTHTGRLEMYAAIGALAAAAFLLTRLGVVVVRRARPR